MAISATTLSASPRHSKMSSPQRSTTGCTTCKARRKKCDEAKPHCLRCLSSRRSCIYEFVEYPESKTRRVKRTKPAPRTSERFVELEASQSILADLPDAKPTPSLLSSISGDSILRAPITSLGPCSNKIYSDLSPIAPRAAANSLSLPSISPVALPGINPTSALPSSSDFVLVPAGMIPPISGSSSQLATFEDDADDDPEGVRAMLCTVPTVDKNLKENSLPFVLHCYSQWAIASVFEPLKVIDAMRDQVIAQFSSENTRTRTILIANVMNMFVKNLAIDGPRKTILNHLALDVQQSGAAFMATPPSFVPVLDRQNAIRTLDSMLEIVGLQLDTHPTSDCIRSLENAAPVFRRACLDLPGRPINLPNLLLDLSLNLRHFATIDIIMSVITGLPTRFRYEVPFSLELCERIYRWQRQGNYGLQWLYGLPDQFIMLFAWINTLSETPGANDNKELIAWIEKQLSQIKVAIDQSGDPFLRIGRMVVLESWRYTVLIYLYMVLCKASADDPRVICAQKGFMRLVQGVKSGRNPDAYLIISMIVAGVATIEERDRSFLRQRILSVREYSEPGTAGNDNMLMLEDIWARTRKEGRAAVWSDLRKACFRVTGR
ncbi:hypothetical protein OPQ81_010345 [Rhizoctonia solani]|nr:hypothetical protein OPQ81_010345 [Rhizoctonia solani]